MEYKFKVGDRLKHGEKIGRVIHFNALNEKPSYSVRLEGTKRKKGMSAYSVWVEDKVEIIP